MTHHADDDGGGTERGPLHSEDHEADAGDAADRLSRLTHDLRGLLDGSLRWVGLAARALPDAAAATEEDIERTRRQLETVHGALERMAELIASESGDRTWSAVAARATWSEAIEHAAETLRLTAADACCRVTTDIDPQAGRLPIGPMYSVVLNGLRNAIESVDRANRAIPGDGEVAVALRLDRSGASPRVVMEISDNGEGPPLDGGAAAVFRAGYTTRAEGRGIGLSLSRELVQEAGGRISLEEGRGAQPGRPGAILRAVVPAWEARA